jgi:acyl carrier protein
MQMRQQVLLTLLGLVVLVGKLLAKCPMPTGQAMVTEQRQGEAGETGPGLAGPGQSGSERSSPFRSGSGLTGSGLTGSGLTGSGLTGSGLTGLGLAGELRELLAELAGRPELRTADLDLPLFGAGIGLDSLTGTLLLREVHRRYGVDVAAEDLNLDALASLASLASFIETRRG